MTCFVKLCSHCSLAKLNFQQEDIQRMDEQWPVHTDTQHFRGIDAFSHFWP